MCGIVACRTHTPAVDYLMTALRRLEYRGYDSAGIAVSTTAGDVVSIRTVGRVGCLDDSVKKWSGPDLDGVGIGHTRWATHGAVTERNAHPHQDCDSRISLVHNGIIENADALRTALMMSGHHFSSEVDSEVLCHLIEDQLSAGGDLVDAVEAALGSAEGTWALAVLERGTGNVVVAANGSPILVACTPVGDFATSDIAAIADWADDFRVLQDGEVVELAGIRRGGGRRFGAARNPVMPCRWKSKDLSLNGYADFMAKEIDEQPEVVARLLDGLGNDVRNGRLWQELGLPPFERLNIIGCGTSLHAGQVIGGLVRRTGGIPASSHVASETGGEIIEPHTLRLAISQSGETADLLSALSTSAVTGQTVLALTNNLHSTLARRADAVLECQAGPEIGVAASKTFVCQVVAGAAVMISALVAMRKVSSEAAGQMADDLKRLPDHLYRAGTAAKDVVPEIVEKLSLASGAVFIGRGSGVPYAAEGALKLKELAYLWTEHCPAGELKHGPLALIETGTPVIVIDNGDVKLKSNVAEVRSRGGFVITVGAAGSTIPAVASGIPAWGPLECVVALQILARTTALSRGHDVDKPRNLAKSVTVE